MKTSVSIDTSGLSANRGIDIKKPSVAFDYKRRYVRDISHPNIFYRNLGPLLPPQELLNKHITNMHKGEVVLMNHYGYIGKPKATEKYTSEQLEKIGLVGLYYAGVEEPQQVTSL